MESPTKAEIARSGSRLRSAMFTALVVHALVVLFGPPFLTQRAPVIQQWRFRGDTLHVVTITPDVARLTASPETAVPQLPGPEPVVETSEELPWDLPEPRFWEEGPLLGSINGRLQNGFLKGRELDPVPVVMVHPEYPPLARAAEAEGRVEVLAVVDGHGFVARVEILKSNAIPLLERAALKAASKWRFRPARQGATTVETRVVIPFVFKLGR